MHLGRAPPPGSGRGACAHAPGGCSCARTAPRASPRATVAFTEAPRGADAAAAAAPPPAAVPSHAAVAPPAPPHAPLPPPALSTPSTSAAGAAVVQSRRGRRGTTRTSARGETSGVAAAEGGAAPAPAAARAAARSGTQRRARVRLPGGRGVPQQQAGGDGMRELERIAGDAEALAALEGELAELVPSAGGNA
jgi:hypothetical protein